MTLTRRQINALIKTVSLTKPDEATCDECLKDLGEFAERQLAGKPISEGLKAIEHHLLICEECREEYEALLRMLDNIEDETAS